MAYQTRMADLTMSDMRRLHLAGQRLMALTSALQSTNLQGKPALLQLIGEVQANVDAIFRKGVVGLANHFRRGRGPTRNDDPEFGAHCVAVMEAEAAKRQTPAPVCEAPAGDGAAPIGTPMSTAPEMPTAEAEPALGAIFPSERASS
jgi:hypothetical protein